MKFRCIVTRDTTESCVVEVEAIDKAQAEQLAVELTGQPGITIEHKWEQDETPNMSKDRYCTDVEEIQ